MYKVKVFMMAPYISLCVPHICIMYNRALTHVLVMEVYTLHDIRESQSFIVLWNAIPKIRLLKVFVTDVKIFCYLKYLGYTTLIHRRNKLNYQSLERQNAAAPSPALTNPKFSSILFAPHCPSIIIHPHFLSVDRHFFEMVVTFE